MVWEQLQAWCSPSYLNICACVRFSQGRRRFAEALYQKLLHDCSTLMCSVARMFLAKRYVQRRRVLYNDSARVIQEAYVGRRRSLVPSFHVCDFVPVPLYVMRHPRHVRAGTMRASPVPGGSRRTWSSCAASSSG